LAEISIVYYYLFVVLCSGRSFMEALTASSIR